MAGKKEIQKHTVEINFHEESGRFVGVCEDLRESFDGYEPAEVVSKFRIHFGDYMMDNLVEVQDNTVSPEEEQKTSTEEVLVE